MKSVLFPTHHFLQLLGHLYGMLVLLLGDFTGIQQMLHLLPRIAPEHALELLKPLDEVLRLGLRLTAEITEQTHASDTSSFRVLFGESAASRCSSSSRVT